MSNKIKSIIRSKISKRWHRRKFLDGKIALVLSGGGARSLAQVGVLKVLEKEKIRIDTIVGCSMGAIVGALFSMDVPVEKIEHLIYEFCQLKQIKEIENAFTTEAEGIKKIGEFMRDVGFYIVNWFKEGVWDEKTMVEGLKKIIPAELTFSQTSIPFFCVATDIKGGRRVIIDKGELLQAVVASVSIPGLFTPIKQDGELLVDGGVLSRIPVLAAEKMGADFIMAISSGRLNAQEPMKAMDVIIRTGEVREVEFARIESLLADFLFSPAVEEWDWFSFSKAKEIIKKGEEEASAKVALLKEALNGCSIEKKKLRESILPLFH